MSKENIVKFQDALAQKPELSEKLKDAHTLKAVVAAAQAEGFDFTAEELAEKMKAAAPTGKLNDEALNDVTGGDYEDVGLIVTIGYGCEYWTATKGSWIAAKGNCGSCKYYSPRLEGLLLAGYCFCDKQHF